MHQACPRLGKTVAFPRGQVNGMAVNSTFAQQPLCFVGIKIIARLREKVAHPGNFIVLF